MKISYNWLKQFIDSNLLAEEVAAKLTMAGLEVNVIPAEKDSIFEVEITSNRPDWLSLVGVAREVQAITGVKMSPLEHLPEAAMGPAFPIEIEDKQGCLRYIARIIKDVKIAESPAWMKQRLEAVGSRTINNGADITNYCLYETGQPLHAFDLNKLEGGKIIVRRAKKGEKITTIDGVERELDESILVIADAVKPVAIAGIMGGLDTEVTENTRNILLESAWFDPVIIRRASRKLGLSTEANYRFERGADIKNVDFSSRRAAVLYRQVCEADVSTPASEVNLFAIEPRQVRLSPWRVTALVGTDIPFPTMKEILEALGFKVNVDENDFIVDVPSFRRDVNIEEDLIEEIARIWGYDKIPVLLPPQTPRIEPARGPLTQSKDALRVALTGMGLNEVLTYTLVSGNAARNARAAADKPVKIMNPLSSEQEFMRASLLPNFLKAVNLNLNRKRPEIKIFEIARVYGLLEKGFSETETIGIALCGSRHNNWQDHQKPVNFYDIKGMVEELFEKAGVKTWAIRPSAIESFDPEQAAEFVINDEIIGHCGRIAKDVLKNFDITEDVYFAAIQLEPMLKHSAIEYHYEPVPRYPSSSRDIAIVVPETVTAEQAFDVIRASAGDLAETIRLFDVYKGEQVPKGSKSLAFTIEYRSKETTLTEDQVTKLYESVKQALETKLSATLR